MLRVNSIFIKVLVPVLAVMLMQALLISLVMRINGTISSLENSVLDALHKNAENRADTLEGMMVRGMSSLDKMENDITLGFQRYLAENNLSDGDMLGDYEQETAFLAEISSVLVGTLRVSGTTGVYIYLIDDGPPDGQVRKHNGLYYRDLDPGTTPSDASDILFLRGFVDTARKEKITLDSLWTEAFTFSPQNAGLWREYSQVLNAAYNSNGFTDLSYWNPPHFVNALSPLDSNECISYSRPIFYNGRPIAVIGTEMLVDQLQRYFPDTDFDVSGKGGYMLLHHTGGGAGSDGFDTSVCAVTGAYIKQRLTGAGDAITLLATQREKIFTIANRETAHAAVETLTLYNPGARYADETWALASVAVDSMLFEASHNVSRGILLSAAIALLIGTVLIALTVRHATRPLISIVRQIKTRSPEESIDPENSDTYEITQLCSAINDMRELRRCAEAELVEERERYLFALESAANPFMEYDAATGVLRLYAFVEGERQPRLHETHNIRSEVAAGTFCHTNDIGMMLDYMAGKIGETAEFRIAKEFCRFIPEQVTDKGYYWFACRASFVRDEQGNVRKAIGIVRENTQEALRRNAAIEATRQDRTTGLYNREFGLRRMREYARSLPKGFPFAMCVIRIHGFDLFEAYYGRLFAAAILNRLGHALRETAADGEISVRLCNDEFLLFLPGADKDIAHARMGRLRAEADGLYAGENTDLRLVLSAGTAMSSNEGSLYDVMASAYRAAMHPEKPGQTVFAGDLPPEVMRESLLYRSEPIEVSLELAKENIVGLTFDLFEKTADIRSVIGMLLALLGPLYSLRQILVCNFDADFDANQIIYQWNAPGVQPYHENIESVPREALEEAESALDANNTLLYNQHSGFGEGARQLLCVQPGEEYSAFACFLYESGAHLGRIVYKANDPGHDFTPADQHNLLEIARIISAHISIERSHSASRAKSDFLSRMSHEIRTPMNAIIGMTNMASNSIGDDGKLRDCLDKIGLSARHLLGLINDVLDMSRIESGKMQLSREPLSLRGLLAEADTLMRPQIESKGVAFETALDIAHDMVWGDGPRLRQVLLNFLGNAFKFTNTGGTIRMEITEREAGLYRFSVKDSGIGIGKEDQALVFKAFEQAREGGRREGTGLGLAISSSIIAAMDSRIELQSEPGVGSEFFFTLRLDRAEEAHDNAAGDAPLADFTGKRALLVEDNEINVEIARYILTDRGLTVDVARNGKEALTLFFDANPGTYDVILMDIQMPVMDGLTATREIRRNRARPDAQTIPIIAMTADAFDEDMRRSIESGMNGHIAKPVDIEKLFTLLGNLLNREESTC